ncbi:MAG: hypothetical protein KGL34_03475, partial [Gammaproteobacteria bacterium]|nr:hypothetical protein [Gammaproteobacteria bacterium]
PAVTSAAAGATAVNPYGEHSLVSNLQALLQDLAAGPSSSGRFDRAASHLNQAFTKLIGDLRSLAPAQPASTSTGSSPSTTASTGTGGTTGTDTSALQRFLGTVLSGLQQNGGNPSPLGNAVNTTA